MSRYTSDYNGNDNESSNYNETHQELVNENDNENENESDQEEHQSTFNIDYAHDIRDMVLTTPSSAYFDQKHKEYENDMKRYEDDNAAPIRASNSDDTKYDSDTLLNDIHGNSTEERKQSTYLNKAEVESTNYDISASEIKDRTSNNNTGEKRAKFMQEGSHVNLTIPDAGEVWALASMKNVVHTKNNQGQFYNVTTEHKDPNVENNGTLVTKQLADWAEVTKNNDFTNTSYRRTNVSQNLSRLKAQLSDYFDVLKNMNKSNSNNTVDNNIDNSSIIINNNTNINTNRGKVKFQSKPLITSDQDSAVLASQENQIIAVRMTTLPPPLAVTRNHTQHTQTPIPIHPKISDSENKINIHQTGDASSGVTEVVTENESMESTTTPIEITQTVDNSQNELKTRFTNTNVTALDETTTEKTAGVTTETEGTTTFDDNSTTDQVDEATTLLTTIQPEENQYVYSTTDQEFPTTNKVNLETDSTTESDDDEEDHTIHEQTSITAAKQPMTTEDEVLDSQSSTLQPKYTEMEKTTEIKQPTTEVTRTSAELLQPTTEYITQSDNEDTNRLPDPDNREEITTSFMNPDIFKYGTVKSIEHLLDGTTQASQSADAIPEVIDDITQPQEHESTTDSHIVGFDGQSLNEPDTNAIIAISVSVVGVVIVATVIGVLLIMRKRQKQLTYGQRCRPVGLDAYSLDNVSVYNSVRRKGALRMSKRSYGNAAFDDPGLKNNLLSGASLTAFSQKRNEIYEEFKELPSITARADEVPAGCEDKNR